MHRPAPTLTLGPIHFEDLEPHRFEDLVRQLLYDFRDWRQIEATGRSGADQGFDARGWEIAGGTVFEPDTEDILNDSALAEEGVRDRLWLIQCKREKSISPAKLRKHLLDIKLDTGIDLHGIIFAVASDISSKTREVFRTELRELGATEGYLWGKGEIEDMLFQPKNDHLLFAYFGVSLRARRQSLRTEVRARLAMKRKASKFITGFGTPLLVRDGSDTTYPYSADAPSSLSGLPWRVWTNGECKFDGVHLPLKRCFAFIDDDGEGWDFAEKMNDVMPHGFENPWETDQDSELVQARRRGREEAFPTWDALPPANKAWFEVFDILPYENIIDLDEKGDEHFEHPHIYTVPRARDRDPFREYQQVVLETIGASRRATPDPSKRIVKFIRKSPAD
jgi:hypothetical protein